MFVISGLLESESAVSGNDKQRVRKLVLNTQLVYQRIEFSVNVSADDNVLGFRGMYVYGEYSSMIEFVPIRQESFLQICDNV